MSKIQMLKKDAVVDIKIGTGFLKKLQEALIEVSSNHTEEEVNQFRQLVDSKSELTEPWMETVLTIITLVKAIEEEAIKQGLVYDEDVDNVINQQEN